MTVFTNKKPMAMNLNIRKAKIEDLPQIVKLLADDPLGNQRERYQNPLPQQYVGEDMSIETKSLLPQLAQLLCLQFTR